MCLFRTERLPYSLNYLRSFQKRFEQEPERGMFNNKKIILLLYAVIL